MRKYLNFSLKSFIMLRVSNIQAIRFMAPMLVLRPGRKDDSSRLDSFLKRCQVTGCLQEITMFWMKG
jgi:hypothetical protein